MKKKKTNESLRTKIVLGILTGVSVFLIIISVLAGDKVTGPLKNVTGVLITPIQKGINNAGNWLSNRGVFFIDSSELKSENKDLKAQVEQLTSENTQLIQDQDELARLRSLYELDAEYEDYEKIGAHVVSRNSGNWFDTFTIDKGTDDGIAIDMNVIADGGLVGIVTTVGNNWATVRSIIDDNSNVSAMVSSTKDTCIIAGSLELIDEGCVAITNLMIPQGQVNAGDTIVTSQISEKYLPGIMIGYVSEITKDANDLTYSGKVTPVADFAHLMEVLVITTTKAEVPAEAYDTKTTVSSDVAVPAETESDSAAASN